MGRRRFVPGRATLVVVAALVLQAGLVGDVRVAGAVGNLALVVTVAAAVTGGADRGVAYGFASGLGLDLLIDAPFGQTALALAVTGWVIGLMSAAFVRPPTWWAPAVAVVAGLLAAALTTLIGNVVGAPYPAGDIVRIGLVEGVVAAVLAVPAVRALRWAHGTGDEVDRYRVVLR